MEPAHPPAGGPRSAAARLPEGAVRAVARRPDLWATAVRQAFRLAEPGWWRRRPCLPLPSPEYLRFRMVTAYGGTGSSEGATGADLVTYLEWCRAWPDVAGGSHPRPPRRR